MPNAVFKMVGNVFVSVYSERNPTDAEAAVGTQILKEAVSHDCTILVVTRGGAATPAQRKRVYEVLGGREPRAAIVSDSRVVRGVVTAMSWFNKKNVAFSMEYLDDAFEYLQIPTSQHDLLRRTIADLESKLTK